MNDLWLINVAPLILLLPAFIYSAVKTVRPKVPLYFQITFGGAVCACLEFIYYNVLLLCATESFQSGNMKNLSGLGSLAIGGFCAFLFAANFGQFDSIIDGGQKRYRKERLLSLVAPALVLGATVWALIASEERGFFLILITVINLSCMLPCSYYNLKFILIKDDGTGFVRGAKMLNISSLLYILLQQASTVLYLLEGWITNAKLFSLVDKLLYFLIAAAIGMVFIFSVRGKKKWMSQ